MEILQSLQSSCNPRLDKQKKLQLDDHKEETSFQIRI